MDKLPTSDLPPGVILADCEGRPALCVDCGENVPEDGTVCDEFRYDRMGDD